MAEPQFFHLLEGTLRNQGIELSAGGGYAAAAGSTHTDFEALTPAQFLSIFKI